LFPFRLQEFVPQVQRRERHHHDREIDDLVPAFELPAGGGNKKSPPSTKGDSHRPGTCHSHPRQPLSDILNGHGNAPQRQSWDDR